MNTKISKIKTIYVVFDAETNAVRCAYQKKEDAVHECECCIYPKVTWKPIPYLKRG